MTSRATFSTGGLLPMSSIDEMNRSNVIQNAPRAAEI